MTYGQWIRGSRASAATLRFHEKRIHLTHGVVIKVESNSITLNLFFIRGCAAKTVADVNKRQWDFLKLLITPADALPIQTAIQVWRSESATPPYWNNLKPLSTTFDSLAHLFHDLDTLRVKERGIRRNVRTGGKIDRDRHVGFIRLLENLDVFLSRELGFTPPYPIPRTAGPTVHVKPCGRVLSFQLATLFKQKSGLMLRFSAGPV